MDSIAIPSLPWFGWVLFALWAVLAFFAVSLVLGGLAGLWKRRVFGGGTRLCCGLVLGGGVATLGALGLGMQSYHRLTHEQAALHIAFVQTEPGRYRAELTYPDGTSEPYVLYGQEWQVDARVLRWKGPAVVAGLDTAFRLERVSGRYRDVAQERSEPRSVYAIGNGLERLDLWTLARRHPDRVPWVDALYGSATYLPMADGAEYEVTVTASGLAARPLNDAARKAVREW